MRTRPLLVLSLLVGCAAACVVISGADELVVVPTLEAGGGDAPPVVTPPTLAAACEELVARAVLGGCPEVVEGLECDACAPFGPAAMEAIYGCMLTGDVCDASTSNVCFEAAMSAVASSPEYASFRAKCAGWVRRCDGGAAASVSASLCGDQPTPYAVYGPQVLEGMGQCFDEAGCDPGSVSQVAGCLTNAAVPPDGGCQ